MATITGYGVSAKLDSFAAGREAAQNTCYRMGRYTPDIAITFISTIFDQVEAIKGIRSAIKEAPLIGCSSAGSITPNGFLRGSVSVFTLYSDSISFSCGIGKNISKNARLAGHEAAKEAFSKSIKDKTTKAYIMFSDGLTGNSADILRGAQEVLGTSFPIIGGAAADELCFQKTYQYVNNNIYSDAVVGLLISGNINVGIGKGCGWQPIGRPHKITKSKSNIIKEIDRKPAVEIYEEYFEKSFEELKGPGIAKLGINYPLGIKIKEKNDYLARIPLKLDDNGSLVLSAEIPEGSDVNIMIGDKNLTLAAAKSACTEAARNIQKHNIKFITVFTDIGRYNLLRKDSIKEIESIKGILGKNTPIIGFCTYGEYASLDTYTDKGWADFQNEAFSIGVFSE